MEDRTENEFPTKTDCEWIRGLDSNGNSIRISKNDLLSTIKTVLCLGEGSTEGRVLFTDNYGNGNLLVFGQTYSYGSAYIGYCMKMENGRYLSTTPISIPRSIFVFGPEGLKIGTASTQSTPINDEIIGLSWKTL